MHNKVISKIRCYTPNLKNTPVRNYNYLYYIATREGVDLHPLNNKPSAGRERPADNETYLRYIHERPHSNGLFGNIDTSDLNFSCRRIREISETQCVYRGILSLSEEDAKELGFLSKKAWHDFLTLSLPEISDVLGISAAELEWVAAFHNEKGHPHVHYMLWNKNSHHVQTPFISIPQQHRCRELFSGRFFAVERSELSYQKNTARDSMLTAGKKDTQTELQKLVEDICCQPSYQELRKVNRSLLDESSRQLLDLAESLPRQGSIKYAYLPPEVKKKVDLIVETMLGKRELKEQYDSFLNFHKRIAETYSPTQKELRVAIMKGKEDIERRLANIVLKSAQELRSDKDFFYSLQSTRLPGYRTLLKNGISEKTVSALKDEVQKGDSQAAYLLGRIYDDPESGFYDAQEAVHYYKLAAEDNNSSAKSILGSKYIWGKDVEPDEKLGRRYLHEAQEAGEQFAKDAEQAYDSYQKEHANYKSISLMANLLSCLCYANHTKSPSSVYRPSYDKDNKKIQREKARINLYKHSEHLER